MAEQRSDKPEDPGTNPGRSLDPARPWRIGRQLSRTLYFHDRFVGMVDTPGLAILLVTAANEHHARKEQDLDKASLTLNNPCDYEAGFDDAIGQCSDYVGSQDLVNAFRSFEPSSHAGHEHRTDYPKLPAAAKAVWDNAVPVANDPTMHLVRTALIRDLDWALGGLLSGGPRTDSAKSNVQLSGGSITNGHASELDTESATAAEPIGVTEHGDKVYPTVDYRAKLGRLEADVRAMRNVLGARPDEGNLACAVRVATAGVDTETATSGITERLIAAVRAWDTEICWDHTDADADLSDAERRIHDLVRQMETGSEGE